MMYIQVVDYFDRSAHSVTDGKQNGTSFKDSHWTNCYGTKSNKDFFFVYANDQRNSEE